MGASRTGQGIFPRAERLHDGILGPRIIIVARINRRRFPIDVIIDSGSDVTVLPKGVIESQSELDPANLRTRPNKAIGVGGIVPVHYWPNRCRLSYHGVEFFDGHCDVIEDLPYGLLGRADFFKVFDVRFHWAADPSVFEFDATHRLSKSHPIVP